MIFSSRKKIVFQSSQRNWHELSWKQKVYLLRLTNKNKVFFLSPELWQKNSLVQSPKEVVFLFSLEFLLYLLHLKTSNIIMNLKYIRIFPNRWHGIFNKINNFFFSLQNKAFYSLSQNKRPK